MATTRLMTAADWERHRAVRLAALLDAPSAFASTFADESARSAEQWESMVRERCESKLSMTWLAELDGETVGLVGAFRDHTHASSAQLVSMWVEPSARGHGLARRLVDEVLTWAKGAGLADVSLWVARGNDAAQSLYESTGFVVTGEFKALPSDPCENEIRMTHPLD